MTDEKTLPEMYHKFISISVDEVGVYPHHMVSVDGEGKRNMYALDLTPGQVLSMVLKTLQEEKPKELIFALDRFSKPDQGTTLGDLVAGAYWKEGVWKPFIIEYQNEPRIVKELNWDNEWWNAAITRELTQLGQKVA